jgi:hypothetical protein
VKNAPFDGPLAALNLNESWLRWPLAISQSTSTDTAPYAPHTWRPSARAASLASVGRSSGTCSCRSRFGW